MPGRYETYDGTYLPVRADTGVLRVLSPDIADAWPEIAPDNGWTVIQPIRRGEESPRELVVVQATLHVAFCAAASHPGMVGRPVTGLRTQDLQIVVDAGMMPWALLGSVLSAAAPGEISPGDIPRLDKAPTEGLDEALLGALAKLLRKRV